MLGESPEAFLLHTANVLHKAKHEKIASEYLDSDLTKALKIFKSTALGKNVIHNRGQNFVNVIYCTAHQIQIYK